MAKHHGHCKLCGKHTKLVKSHVIPEWVYRPLYDSDHRLIRIAANDRFPVSNRSTGEWDRIMCQGCEDSFNKYDEYGRALIFSKPGEKTFGIQCVAAEYGVDIHGVDYARAKLFQLSVLWRAGVSERDVFSGVQLGEHEPRIRDMLLKEQPGQAHEYGCFMGALLQAPRELMIGVVDAPTMFTKDGWTVVRFLFAGNVWIYVLHENGRSFPLEMFFLTPGQPLRLHIRNVEDSPELMEHLVSMTEPFRKKIVPGRVRSR